MFENLLMQVTGDTIQSFSASIIALTTAVVAIVGVAAKFIGSHSRNQKVDDWAGKIATDSDAVKSSLQATDQWVLENQAKFTAGFALVNSMLTPEQQATLQAKGLDITKLQAELDAAKKELDVIYSTTPSTTAAQATPKLPGAPF